MVEIANNSDSGNSFELESGPSEPSSEDNEEIPESSDYSSQDIFLRDYITIPPFITNSVMQIAAT